jgi:predicted P-loop ATPase
MPKIIPFMSERRERADPMDEAERQRSLFAWAHQTLTDLGLVAQIVQASSLAVLRSLRFDENDPAVALAIRAALHPATGLRADHFVGLSAGVLKRLLHNRFEDLKKDREKELLRGHRARGGQPDWTAELMFGPLGEVLPTLGNLIVILTKSPWWLGILGYDEFKARVVARKPLPWEPGKSKTAPVPWTDHQDVLTRVWLERNSWVLSPVQDARAKFKFNKGDVGCAVQAAAKHAEFHPVRDYFETLILGDPELPDTWLIRFFGAPDTPYVRAVSSRWLISAVARVYEPGCKVDHMLVLEGDQGKQKSEALRILAIRDEWFIDRLSNLSTKDAAIELAGHLIIEDGELAALIRSSSPATKSFITRRSDKFRPPYAKHLIDLPRQCVLAGTINPPSEGYLKDSTGARRVWPVLTLGMIDLAGLRQALDALWAAAVRRHKRGDPWWLETPDLEALAATEQAARFIVDPWEPLIREWLGNRVDVSISEVLQGALGITRDEEVRSKTAAARVGRIFKSRLKWSRRHPRDHGKKGDREWRYYKN